ncbi:MAG: DUF4255 domain-containing protein [Deltaproteobacteria bacterium]|jgi:hypothetical protein|nr:DUF4255 domain-containing protein [Deltaproteobacteria bacterium]
MMSNHLAIATVTATLSQLLQKLAESIVSGVSVTTGRPKGMGSGTSDPEINVYLYQLIPNPAFRNADLPTRRDNGTLVDRPQAALDLHYLLTFYGEETQLVPQRLLGSTASFLHSRPVLTRKMIEDTVSTAGYLNGSDLADQVEKVKFSPLPLNLEELSKLWSVFFQTPHALSVAYQASLVLIEAEEIPQQALPVRRRGVYVRPFRQPVIERITSAPQQDEPDWADQPILAGHMLKIFGSQLRGEVTRVRIGGVEVEPASVSDSQISLPLSSPPLPEGSLRAGIQGLQIVHEIMMGTPPEPHRGFESNLAAFVLQATVTNVDLVKSTDDSTPVKKVIVTLTPKVGKRQRVVLLLNELNPPSNRTPYAYRFNAPQDNGITGEGVDETESIPLTITDESGKCLVQLGDYLVRVQVDRAESPLEIDSSGRYSGPEVTIP